MTIPPSNKRRMQAMKHLLLCKVNDDEAIDLAIETVGKAENDDLTHMLVEYLMGEPDGLPKVGVTGMLLHNHLLQEMSLH